MFHNTKNKDESLNDDKAHITIQRAGGFELSSLQDLHNKHIFKGSENPLTTKRVYTEEFICEFDMKAYPFDTQECSAVFVMKGNVGKLLIITIKMRLFSTDVCREIY